MTVYALASLPGALKLLRKQSISALFKFKINLESARLALVPTALPPLFALVQRIIERLGELFLDQVSADRQRAVAARISAVFCSPLLLLLPSGIRIYAVIHALTGALRAFAQTPLCGAEKNVQARGWRRYLSPIWTLALGNAIMLPLWLFGPKGTFPKAYDRIIINVSNV
jgi:hypothetical protein